MIHSLFCESSCSGIQPGLNKPKHISGIYEAGEYGLSAGIQASLHTPCYSNLPTFHHSIIPPPFAHLVI